MRILFVGSFSFGVNDIVSLMLRCLRRMNGVEVHHADLRTGYTARDWPPDLVEELMRRRDRELREDGVGITLVADDLGRTWVTGPGPTVHGPAADLVWWLLGRGSGEGLVCSDGALPDLGGWV